MNPKNGTTVTCVKPVSPGKVLDADEADPGEVEKIKAQQRQEKSGKYGSTTVEPFEPPKDDAANESASDAKKEPTPKGWVEVEMVDEAGDPVAGLRYEVTLPDGRVDSGTLDSKGFARIEGFEPGYCKVSFPDLDTETWDWA